SIGDYKAAIAMGNWGPGPLFVFRDPSSGWAYGIQTAGGPNNWTCAGISPPLSYLTTVDNTFHHVAVVLDAPASRCDLYSDGQLIHTDLFVDGQTSFGTDPLYIGGFGDFDRLHSEIDDVRLYNRALSAAEVQQLSSMGGP
ncbi:MAG: LamG domain-containing protein, partial [Deltaproteobacteria bacterium]|nr:LamG domain-containing protein [Deltaproteobacteria bacterium]